MLNGPLPVNFLTLNTYIRSLLAKTDFWFNGAERRDPDRKCLSTVSSLIKIFPLEESTCLFYGLEFAFKVAGKVGSLKVGINSFGAVCISIPFPASMRKSFLYFVFEYFRARLFPCKNTAFGVIKLLQISLNNCARKSRAVTPQLASEYKRLLCPLFRAVPTSEKPDEGLVTQPPPLPSSFHGLI